MNIMKMERQWLLMLTLSLGFAALICGQHWGHYYDSRSPPLQHSYQNVYHPNAKQFNIIPSLLSIWRNFLRNKNRKQLTCFGNPCGAGQECVEFGQYNGDRLCVTTTTTSTTTPTPPICYQDPCNLPAPVCSDNPDGSSRCGCKSCFDRSDTDVCTDASFDCRNGYLTAYNRKLAFVAAQVITEVNSVCACKTACAANLNCKTASVEPTATDGVFNCITSTDPIHDLALQPLTGSYTFAKENSFDHYFSKESGTFYKIIERVEKNFDQIKEICEGIPNGQIIILKNAQDVLEYRAFAETFDETRRNTDAAYQYIVGLEWNTATTSLQWADGTPFDMSAFNGLVTMDTITGTELGYLALYNANTINIQGHTTSWPACQIRPFA